MPMNTSGQMRISNGSTSASNTQDAAANYWSFYGGGLVTDKLNLNWYRNRTFYYNTGAVYRPNTQPLSMSHFYGSSPYDEWNCACMCK